MTEANKTQANENANAANEESKVKGFFRRHGKKMAIGFGVGLVGGGLYAGARRYMEGGFSGAGEAVSEKVEEVVHNLMK